VARGAARGTANVAQGTANVARGAARGTANAVRGTGQAVGNAVTGNAVNNNRNAPWRFTRHNGEWWYYTPQNQWMYHRNGQWNTYSANNFQRLNATSSGNAQIAQGGPAMQQRVQRFSYAPQGQQAPQRNAPAARYNGGYSSGYGNADGDSFIQRGRWDFGGNLPAQAPRNVNQDGVPATWGNVTR
jgi:hypothetical protein